MYQTLKKYLIFAVATASIGLLSGCSDKEQELADTYANENARLTTIAASQYKKLENTINNPAVKGQYELVLSIALEKLGKENAESEAVNELIRAFKNDMTTNGTPFNAIKDDYTKSILEHKAYSLNGVIPAPKAKINDMKNLNLELNRVTQAMALKTYDQVFIDYINTVAAISSTVDPVLVDSLNNDAPFASQFVGNPAYGEWKEDSNGNSSWSFWQTYGMISFIDDMFFDNGRRYGNSGYYDYNRNYDRNYYNNKSSRYRYDNWNNTRNYSYYNDVYSKKYESKLTKSKIATQDKKLKTKYASNLAKSTPATKQAAKVNKNPSNKRFASNLAKPKNSVNSSSSNRLNNSNKSIKNPRTSGGSLKGGGK